MANASGVSRHTTWRAAGSVSASRRIRPRAAAPIWPAAGALIRGSRYPVSQPRRASTTSAAAVRLAVQHVEHQPEGQHVHVRGRLRRGQVQHRGCCRAGPLPDPRADRLPGLRGQAGPGLADPQVAQPLQETAQPNVIRGDAENHLGQRAQDVVTGDHIGRARRVAVRGHPLEQQLRQPRHRMAQTCVQVLAGEHARHRGPRVQRLDPLPAEPGHQRVTQVVDGPVGQARSRTRPRARRRAPPAPPAPTRTGER